MRAVATLVACVLLRLTIVICVSIAAALALSLFLALPSPAPTNVSQRFARLLVVGAAIFNVTIVACAINWCVLFGGSYDCGASRRAADGLELQSV